MNESEIRDIMAGGGGFWGKLLRPGLWLASRSYGDITAWRRWHYRKGWYKSYAVEAPVISVGNLTTGGTGKTPVVAWVVDQLQKAGREPAVVTRGYKARGGKSDEAEMLCCLSDCSVVVNADRVAGAQTAIVTGSDTIVLDDGFQHRRLKRDLDIVLIDALNPFGYNNVLPRGLMRERRAALRDAHAIVITRSDLVDADRLAELREILVKAAPQASIHSAVHQPSGGVDEQGQAVELSELTGKRAVAFCGLGNPDGFFGTLGQLDVDVVGQLAFDDHVDYTPELAERISQQADAHEAEILITTQKDAVKLSGLSFARPVFQLAVTITLTDGGDELLAAIAAVAPPVAKDE
jgi:tetraacyldisaccharide 4'-kinase